MQNILKCIDKQEHETLLFSITVAIFYVSLVRSPTNLFASKAIIILYCIIMHICAIGYSHSNALLPFGYELCSNANKL